MSEQFWISSMIFGLLAITILCPFLIFLGSEEGASFALEWGVYVFGSVLSLTGPPLAYYFQQNVYRFWVSEEEVS